MQLEAQLSDRGVTFELSPEAIAWLAEKGFDERMGARPLGRVIQEHIKKPLADEVLFGKLKNGGTVKVTVEKNKDGEPALKLQAIEDQPVKPAQVRKPSRPSNPGHAAPARHLHHRDRARGDGRARDAAGDDRLQLG